MDKLPEANDENYSKPYKETRSTAKTDEELAIAIKATHGLQYLAAEAAGITKGCMSQRLKKSAFLRQVRDEARQTRIDNAELKLTTKVDKEDLGAICFTLKTIGKDRGYTESSTFQFPQEAMQAFEKVMKAVGSTQEVSPSREDSSQSTRRSEKDRSE